MGWLLCFLLLVVALIGSQFSTADRDPVHSVNKARSTSWSAPSPHSSGDPASQSEGTGQRSR